MTIHEFGTENTEIILLIHPSVVKWDYFENVIPLLEKKYHLLVPALPGYDFDNDSDFTSVEQIASDLNVWMKAQGYRMPFFIMTGYGDIPGAVEAVKRGAADYLPKPIQTEKVLGIIRGLLNRRNRKKVKERAFYVGKSPLAVKLQNIVRVLAPADS